MTDSGAAFSTTPENSVDQGATGLALRDWFAGMALQAILHDELHPDVNAEEFAKAAYRLADAMLKVRETPSVES